MHVEDKQKPKSRGDNFGTGFSLGMALGIGIAILFMWSAEVRDPKLKYHPDYLLNSPEWYIDSSTTIHGEDTTTTYFFSPSK